MQEEEKKQIGTTDDLSKDMIFEGDEYKNDESKSHSTASEGELKQTDHQQTERADTFKGNEEDSTDNAVGQNKQNPETDRTQRPSLEQDEKVKPEGDDITS